MLTPYELGQEIARIQIGPAGNTKMSLEKAKEIAHLLGIEEDRKVEFLEGYQNKFAEIMHPCDLCGGGAGEINHVCTVPDPGDVFTQPASEFEDEDVPPWLPSWTEIEAAEIELTARELEESQQAYREMVEDESPIRGYPIFSWLRD